MEDISSSSVLGISPMRPGLSSARRNMQSPEASVASVGRAMSTGRRRGIEVGYSILLYSMYRLCSRTLASLQASYDAASSLSSLAKENEALKTRVDQLEGQVRLRTELSIPDVTYT